MSIKVILTDDIKKLDTQIIALKAIILNDNPMDRRIHEEAIKELRRHREELGGILNEA